MQKEKSLFHKSTSTITTITKIYKFINLIYLVYKNSFAFKKRIIMQNCIVKLGDYNKNFV